MTNATYTNVVSATQSAIKADTTSQQKWLDAGVAVRGFFSSAETFREVKKQFEADAIIPALDKKFQAYLTVEIPRGDKTEQAEVNRKNKATARGLVASYFSRIEAYAFPKEKAEAKPTDAVTAFVRDAIKLARKAQNLEAAPFDLLKAMGFINGLLKELNVSSETEIAD